MLRLVLVLVLLLLLLLASKASCRIHGYWGSVAPFVTQPVKIPVLLRFKKSGTTSFQGIFKTVCSCFSLDFERPRESSMCGDEQIYARYGRGGRSEVLKCAPRDGQARQLFVVLRDPLKRATSAMQWWGRGTRQEFDAIAPSNVTFEDLAKHRRCNWDGCYYFGNFNPFTAATLSQTFGPGPKPPRPRRNDPSYDLHPCGEGNPILGGCPDLSSSSSSSIRSRIRSSIRDNDQSVAAAAKAAAMAAAEAAAENLERDFIVGLTERMGDTLRLASVALGVDASRVCEVHARRQSRGGMSTNDVLTAWPLETVAALNATLQTEWAIYEAATRVFEKQLDVHRARNVSLCSHPRFQPRPRRPPPNVGSRDAAGGLDGSVNVTEEWRAKVNAWKVTQHRAHNSSATRAQNASLHALMQATESSCHGRFGKARDWLSLQMAAKDEFKKLNIGNNAYSKLRRCVNLQPPPHADLPVVPLDITVLHDLVGYLEKCGSGGAWGALFPAGLAAALGAVPGCGSGGSGNSSTATAVGGAVLF
jgi:hypothetical protein